MHASEETPVASPFSDVSAQVTGQKSSKKALFWIFALVLAAVAALAVWYFGSRVISDPLRTLEPFPVGKYFDDYRSLEHSEFRGDLRVENDLGVKEGVGRLMLFTFSSDPNVVPVMLAPDLSSIYFTKGQKCHAKLTVKEGGLIYAVSIRKD